MNLSFEWEKVGNDNINCIKFKTFCICATYGQMFNEEKYALVIIYKYYDTDISTVLHSEIYPTEHSCRKVTQMYIQDFIDDRRSEIQ